MSELLAIALLGSRWPALVSSKFHPLALMAVMRHAGPGAATAIPATA